ncbi:MAG: hypothetical protein Q9191_003693 [Dirinaria sp. TL-2023a]
MSAVWTWRTARAVCMLSMLLATVVAQTVVPSNSSLPASEHLYALQKQSLKGPLVLATPQSPGSVQQGSIAYISCEPSAYAGGNIDANRTINLTVQRDPQAIVLFSNKSAHCDFNGTDSFHNDVIYTMTEAQNSSQLQLQLLQGHLSGPVSIQMDSDNGNNTGSGGNPQFNGHSPTTAVAMIILYSITGIITALFLIIIVVGAIRAHRHPERYGPRNMIGRARQSRARGIARAMLDTLPIVKFGEREGDKTTEQGRDVEMGGVTGEPQTTPTPATENEPKNPKTPDPPIGDHTQHQEPEPVTTETAAGADSMGNNADNGLACSVCVDDFVKGQDIRVLPCNHKFHPECIDPWLLNVSGTCPLCRVDLRPTASHTSQHSDHTSGPMSAEEDPEIVTSGNHEAVRALSDQPTETGTRSERRRSRTGLSAYLQHTLNRGRMLDATPEERVAALRRLRTVDRANESESSGAINRLSARLSRALDGERRRGSYAG